MTAANDLAVRRALEGAGVEFIDENGGGPGSAPQGKAEARDTEKNRCGPCLTLIEALLIDARVSQIKACLANAVPHDRRVRSGLLAAGTECSTTRRAAAGSSSAM